MLLHLHSFPIFSFQILRKWCSACTNQTLLKTNFSKTIYNQNTPLKTKSDDIYLLKPENKFNNL